MAKQRDYPVKSHSILLPASIWLAVDRWHVDPARWVCKSAVLELVIKHALAFPDEVKASLNRVHLLGAPDPADPRKSRTIALRPSLWTRVEVHQRRYGLPSRGEAMRELLRLGLGLPQPAPAPGHRLKRARSSPHDGSATKQRIADLFDAGWPLSRIATEVGVTRQRVYQVLAAPIDKDNPLSIAPRHQQTAAVRAKIAALGDDGMDEAAIATEVGASLRFVRGVLSGALPVGPAPVKWWETAA